MEVAARSRLDMKVKAEDDSGDARMADDKPTYRSWKKKYRKMRIIFDQKMHDGEELHKLEQKALATAKRLAVQKDRLLDLLLDVNNSPQIPPEKRIDLSIDLPSDDETDDDALYLDLDRPSTPPPGPAPAQPYKKLLREVPHFKFASAAEQFPSLLADLEAGRDSPADPAQGQSHPPSFLTADDIDNYIWELDAHIAATSAAAAAAANEDTKDKDDAAAGSASVPPASQQMLPTLAPLAHAAVDRASTNPKDAQRDFALRNPTSVYNWLRKHAPKTFLQDGEHHDGKEGGGSGGKDREKDKDKDRDRDHADDGHGHGGGSTSGRRGKGTGERGSRGGGGGGGAGGSARAKRASAAHRAAAAAAAESVEDMDDEGGSYGGGGGRAATPSSATAAGKGKRKRVVDDDPGYRPKGGSSRPAKKKRKSEASGGGNTAATPSSSSRKSAGGRGRSSSSGDRDRDPFAIYIRKIGDPKAKPEVWNRGPMKTTGSGIMPPYGYEYC